MKLNIFAYYNEIIEAFGQPIYDDHEPDKLVPIILRDLSSKVKEGKVENLRCLKLYILGKWDDETGEFVSDKHLILDLGTSILSFEKQLQLKKEENKDE